MKTFTHPSNPTPQIRFNWGFHDGAATIKNGWRRQQSNPDRIYFQGYEAGMRAVWDGTYNEDSSAAWKERRSLREAPWMITHGATGR